MPRKSTPGGTTVSSGAPHASVPPASYYELAIAHVRANGGKGVVVKERETPTQWRAWLAYFAWLDDQTNPRGRKARTFGSMRNGATVPAAWPREFDLSAPAAPPYLPDPPVSPERRRELAAMVRSLVANWGMGAHAPSQSWSNMTPAAAATKLQTIANDNPVQVSTPELAAYLARMREGPGGEEVSG